MKNSFELLQNSYSIPKNSELERDWFSRGYLPHSDKANAFQFITFRLADSLPKKVLDTILVTVKDIKEETEKKKELHRLIEKFLNQGHGSCILKEYKIAKIVEDNLIYYDQKKYQLKSWVIMPNHVHLVLATLPGHSISQVMRSIKGYSAWSINKNLCGNMKIKKVWQKEYYDRYIRDYTHFCNAVRYIHNNPVKAKLCYFAEEWLFSSAKLWRDGVIKSGFDEESKVFSS